LIFLLYLARGMVHHLRTMFTRILPMMGMIKQENYRWVYTAVLFKFCLALIDFQANGDETARITFAPQQFENDAFAAYEVFLTSAWIGSKELKVLNTKKNLIENIFSSFSKLIGSKYVCTSYWSSCSFIFFSKIY
jgi:hypothetical protein